MKRILHLLHYPGNGGSEKYVYDVISRYGPDRCVFVAAQGGPLEEKLRAAGVPCHRLAMRHPLDVRAAEGLAHIARDREVSLIHAHYLRENYIAVLARRFNGGIPVVWTFHVDAPPPPAVRWLHRRITRHNAAVIAVSGYMRNQLVNYGVPQERIRVIYNGVDIDTGPEAMARSRPGGSEAVLGVAGRFSEEKGHRWLIEALGRLRLDRPWRCLLAGDGPLEAELKKAVRDMGLDSRVTFLGHVNPIVPFYRNVDVVVVPSRSEALSYTAIEAMAAGKPVVASRVGGLPEVVRDGETGFLVPYGDTDRLTEAIARVVQNPALAKSFGAKGRLLYESRFTLDHMMDQLLDVYREAWRTRKRG
ncbi:MAG: glycosyltransferase family 4 protein [Kyrpidia sp.]|nr:glycosyltransferase family 4 protein [Kyrpidia sp.]